VELAIQLIASAEEAQSLGRALAELQASEAELQTNVLNQEVILTQTQLNLEKAQRKPTPTRL